MRLPFIDYNIVCYLLFLIGLWLICWSYFGGDIVISDNNIPYLEVGLGINP